MKSTMVVFTSSLKVFLNIWFKRGSRRVLLLEFPKNLIFSCETDGRVVYDSVYPPDLDESRSEDANWAEVYGDVEEAIPENIPEACGNDINITMYVLQRVSCRL